MKNWSFAKIMVVAGGSFAGLILFAALAINMLAKPQTGGSSTSSRVKAAAAQRNEASQELLGPDIVSVQLESAQAALREARQETKSLEQKLKGTLEQRDEQLGQVISSINEELQKISNRLLVLEEARATQTGFAVVRPQRFSNSTGEPTTAPSTETISPPPGFTVRAEMGDRIWLTNGKREISVLKSELQAKASAENKKPEKE